MDLSIDDSKSIDLSAKYSKNNKVSSFLISNRSTNADEKAIKTAKRSTRNAKRLKKKIESQSKLIKMLISWIKIYH